MSQKRNNSGINKIKRAITILINIYNLPYNIKLFNLTFICKFPVIFQIHQNLSENHAY